MSATPSSHTGHDITPVRTRPAGPDFVPECPPFRPAPAEIPDLTLDPQQLAIPIKSHYPLRQRTCFDNHRNNPTAFSPSDLLFQFLIIPILFRIRVFQQFVGAGGQQTNIVPKIPYRHRNFFPVDRFAYDRGPCITYIRCIIDRVAYGIEYMSHDRFSPSPRTSVESSYVSSNSFNNLLRSGFLISCSMIPTIDRLFLPRTVVVKNYFRCATLHGHRYTAGHQSCLDE